MVRFGHEVLLGFGSHNKPPGDRDVNDNSILLWISFNSRWFRIENQSMMEAMRKLDIPETEEGFIETIENMKIKI